MGVGSGRGRGGGGREREDKRMKLGGRNTKLRVDGGRLAMQS